MESEQCYIVRRVLPTQSESMCTATPEGIAAAAVGIIRSLRHATIYGRPGSEKHRHCGQRQAAAFDKRHRRGRRNAVGRSSSSAKLM